MGETMCRPCSCNLQHVCNTKCAQPLVAPWGFTVCHTKTMTCKVGVIHMHTCMSATRKKYRMVLNPNG